MSLLFADFPQPQGEARFACHPLLPVVFWGELSVAFASNVAWRLYSLSNISTSISAVWQMCDTFSVLLTPHEQC